MAFDDDDWGTPVAGGEFARVDALAGRLLVIFPIGYIEHSPTKFSQPGKPSDVVVCDVIDLDAQDEMSGSPGKIYRTMWIRPSKLIVGLRPLIGSKVLGRINKGMAQNGMNPPWEVTDCAHEPGALDRVRAWAASNPHFKVSPFQPPRALAPQGNGFGQVPQQFTPGAGYQGPARQQADFPQQPNQYVQQPQYQQPQQYQQGPPPQQQYPQTQPQQYPPQQPAYNPPPAQPYQAPPQQYQQQPPPPPQQHYPGPQPQQYQQQPPPQQPQAYPVQGAPPQDQGMLERMRLERAERERQQEGNDPWAQGPAPF